MALQVRHPALGEVQGGVAPLSYHVTPLLSAANGSNPNGSNPDEEAIKDDEASWKTVAIVMAILCGIFVLISLLLALNLARRWCYPDKKSPQKQGNNNLQHSYNPLTSTGPKSEDFSDRIPVYNTRTNNV